MGNNTMRNDEIKYKDADFVLEPDVGSSEEAVALMLDTKRSWTPPVMTKKERCDIRREVESRLAVKELEDSLDFFSDIK